jgi:hypothetical protein
LCIYLFFLSISVLVLCTNKMYRNNIYNRTFGDFFSHRKKVLKISFLVYWFKHLILQVFLCTYSFRIMEESYTCSCHVEFIIVHLLILFINFCSRSSFVQLTLVWGRHVAPLGHNIPIPSQPTFDLTCYMIRADRRSSKYQFYIFWF